MGEEREIRKARKEEMRSHLLGNSDNGELQNELIHGGWKQQEVREWPIDDTSSYTTPMLVFTTFIAILGSFPVGFAVGYTSPVQSEIMTDLGLSVAEFSLFGSMLDIGSLVSALVCGKITDYLGRRRALQLADMFYILGSFAMAVAQGPFLLYLGRWMVGFALTIVSYAIPVYIAEFTPKHLRGGFVVLHQLMITIGASIVNLIGLVISWRTLALIGIIPSLVQIVGLFFVPESPRWLMMIGRDEEVRAALQCIRGATADISQEAADMKGTKAKLIIRYVLLLSCTDRTVQKPFNKCQKLASCNSSSGNMHMYSRLELVFQHFRPLSDYMLLHSTAFLFLNQQDFQGR